MEKDRFTPIDLSTWDRCEYFSHYYNHAVCSFSITVNMDITRIYTGVKQREMRLYPVLLWWIATAANRFQFMRFNHDEQGRIGYFDAVHPSFTYMPAGSDRYNVLWCEYSPQFRTFYDRCLQVMACYNAQKLFPLPPSPKNTFDISALPWMDFTAFNLNLYKADTWLPPIITTGKLIKENGLVKLPVSLQIHHAVCDGFHASQFYAALQELADQFGTWQ